VEGYGWIYGGNGLRRSIGIMSDKGITPPPYVGTPNPFERNMDELAQELLAAEQNKFRSTFGDYLEQGWFELSLLGEGIEQPPSTLDWDTYQFVNDSQVIGTCVAYNDECARDYAEMVEDMSGVNVVDIWRAARVPRYRAPQVEDSDMYIGFVVARESPDGKKMPWDYFEKKMRDINTQLAVRKLPDVWDDWRSWHEGAFWKGDREIVARIEDALAHCPEMGMTVYNGWPAQFYLDKKLSPEKYETA
jgi:hypothetical protein